MELTSWLMFALATSSSFLEGHISLPPAITVAVSPCLASEPGLMSDSTKKATTAVHFESILCWSNCKQTGDGICRIITLNRFPGIVVGWHVMSAIVETLWELWLQYRDNYKWADFIVYSTHIYSLISYLREYKIPTHKKGTQLGIKPRTFRILHLPLSYWSAFAEEQ